MRFSIFPLRSPLRHGKWLVHLKTRITCSGFRSRVTWINCNLTLVAREVTSRESISRFAAVILVVIQRFSLA